MGPAYDRFDGDVMVRGSLVRGHARRSEGGHEVRGDGPEIRGQCWIGEVLLIKGGKS